MGKPKTKKKGQADEDVSDDEIANDVNSENEEENVSAPGPAKAKRKAKKNVKKKDDWEDDVADDIAKLSLELGKDENNEEDEVEDIPKVAKKVKTKTKKNKEVEEDESTDDPPKTSTKPSFQMLLMDDDDEEANEEKDEDSDSKPSNIVEATKEGSAGKKKEKKAKKKKEKPKRTEEEDIEAILAGLEAPKEGKKSKKNKTVDSKEPSPVNETTSLEKQPETPVEEDKVLSATVTFSKPQKPEEDEPAEEDLEGGTVKSAAQKRKEKKERDKQKKLKEKQKGKKSEKEKSAESTGSLPPASETAVEGKLPTVAESITQPEDTSAKHEGEDVNEDDGTTSKKKKKKEKGEEKKEKKPKRQVAAILEIQKRIREEQERAEREEQERIAREEEERRIAEEKKRLEEERKQRKKEKERLRKEQLRNEGKLLTEKEKQNRRRFNQMLESMKQQGLELPNREEVLKKKPMYVDKRKKKQQHSTDEIANSPTEDKPEVILEVKKDEEPKAEEVKENDEEATEKTKAEDEAVEEVKDSAEDQEEEDVREAWDESEEEKEEEEEEKVKKIEVKTTTKATSAAAHVAKQLSKDDEEEEDEEESDEESESEEDESEEDEDSEETESEEDARDLVERVREKLQKRHEEAEKKRTTDVLRAAVVCVLGHVDTGKTKILDKLRLTNVQNSEAGGITQQIGATNVPKDEILKRTIMCKEFAKKELKLPGLLIIDTPGHESFSNLRSRGSSLCDIAILVIDIMHGLEQQTIESINLLKAKKTPFVVALNKIDRLYGWQTNPKNDVANTIKKQIQMTKDEFSVRATQVIVQLAENSLNAALFYENKNPKEYISLVPTSAHTGDGMGNLIALICDLCQTMMAKRLSYSEELQASVMEVKTLQGLGTTIDVILVNGKLHVGDQIVVAGTEGPIVTSVKGLLQPQPMRELRVKNQYDHKKEVMAAQGVKVIAKDLEKALAGLPLYVANSSDEVEYYKIEVQAALQRILKSFELKDKGVYVQASTLGSLEALLEFLRTSKIPYSGINIGDVHKRDVTKACAMLEHDKQYAVILAFDVKIERDAQELADKEGVIIFSADIIYNLFDKFTEYVEKLKKERQAEFKHLAVYPCKLRILPQHVYKTRDPIIVGVQVEAGSVLEGTPICIPSKEFLDIGRVVSIESNNKNVDKAAAGMEVCVKIDALPGEAPKMFGRHFDHTDLLVSKISRQSIDIMKQYFRDEMTKADWVLIMELKKMFEIL